MNEIRSNFIVEKNVRHAHNVVSQLNWVNLGFLSPSLSFPSPCLLLSMSLHAFHFESWEGDRERARLLYFDFVFSRCTWWSGLVVVGDGGGSGNGRTSSFLPFSLLLLVMLVSGVECSDIRIKDENKSDEKMMITFWYIPFGIPRLNRWIEMMEWCKNKFAKYA